MSPEAYTAMCDARREFLTHWRAWLRTRPFAEIATSELMATQAAVRDVHDLVTGRFVVDAAGDHE